MSSARKRKMAAARLGIEFGKRYEALALANGQNEVAKAAVDLGQLFNDNIEFTVWVLKAFGGLNPLLPEPIKTTTALPTTPGMLLQ